VLAAFSQLPATLLCGLTLTGAAVILWMAAGTLRLAVRGGEVATPDAGQLSRGFLAIAASPRRRTSPRTRS
jgi:threonine/homoserine/homoserine lactone efflux protein